MSWRYSLIPHLKNHVGDVYEFGVYTGRSMVAIDNAFKIAGKEYRKFFGLDSFEGLPIDEKEQIHQPEWGKAGFNAMSHFKANSINDCVEKTRKSLSVRLDSKKIELVPGFYKDSLTLENMVKYDFGPATYIDIDADLYSSTLEALDFMFSNNLVIKEVTIIGYDDWGGSVGWEKDEDGESRAHKEICAKYKVDAELLLQVGTHFPHVHRIYRINDYSSNIL